jgi:hypothetical protein
MKEQTFGLKVMHFEQYMDSIPKYFIEHCFKSQREIFSRLAVDLMDFIGHSKTMAFHQTDHQVYLS